MGSKEKTALRVACEAWAAADTEIANAKAALEAAEATKAQRALDILATAGDKSSFRFNGLLMYVKAGTKRGQPVAKIETVDEKNAPEV